MSSRIILPQQSPNGNPITPEMQKEMEAQAMRAMANQQRMLEMSERTMKAYERQADALESINSLLALFFKKDVI